MPNSLSEGQLRERRERVFLVLAAFFLGSLAILNVLGITRFIDLSFEVFGLRVPFALAVGVLPYPMTFFCTDLISELYGKKRASYLVWLGLMLNLWVIAILWVGARLPGFEELDPASGEIARDAAGRLPVFFEIYRLTFGAIAASMLAYLTAQFCDVQLFHFWKNLTRGRHLWLRNNGSTLVSQFVDTFAVITITHFYAQALPIDQGQPIWPQLWTFIGSGYVFKMTAALLDTGPFYFGVRYLKRYLRIE